MSKRYREAILFFAVFLIMSSACFGEQAATKAQSDWNHNQGHNFWIKKPLGWERTEQGLAGDLAEEFVEPKRNAFVEVYAAQLADYMSDEMLANGWEESTRKQLAYLEKRISSERINIEGGSGILRVYQSDRKDSVLKTYTLYICQNGKTYVVVGIFPLQMSSAYEEVVKEAVLSFRLTPPLKTKND